MSQSISCCPVTTKIFLVLLRMAIGWHLLYEGLYKLETFSTDDPWSARSYLERAEGPFRSLFRRLVQRPAWPSDFAIEAITESWAAELDEHDRFYLLDEDQWDSAQGELRETHRQLKELFEQTPPWGRTLQQHRRDVAAPSGSLTSSERERLAVSRQALAGQVDKLTDHFRRQLYGLLNPEQAERGDLSPQKKTVANIDWLVVWGLIVGGSCLLTGLFSQLAAVGGAVMLLLFCLAMPPLPGLTAATLGGSHFLYISQNLIESIALLLLATTDSGRWAGIDALLWPLFTNILGRFRQQKEVKITDKG